MLLQGICVLFNGWLNNRLFRFNNRLLETVVESMLSVAIVVQKVDCHRFDFFGNRLRMNIKVFLFVAFLLIALLSAIFGDFHRALIERVKIRIIGDEVNLRHNQRNRIEFSSKNSSSSSSCRRRHRRHPHDYSFKKTRAMNRSMCVRGKVNAKNTHISLKVSVRENTTKIKR